jgi:hypothetical protein
VVGGEVVIVSVDLRVVGLVDGVVDLVLDILFLELILSLTFSSLLLFLLLLVLMNDALLDREFKNDAMIVF